MSATILEALQNAEYNLGGGRFPIQVKMGREQLHNAIVLLEKGYSPFDDFNEIAGSCDDIDSVPVIERSR